MGVSRHLGSVLPLCGRNWQANLSKFVTNILTISVMPKAQLSFSFCSTDLMFPYSAVFKQFKYDYDAFGIKIC
jgi:hypothetical protein